MTIKKIIHRSVGKISSALHTIKNLKRRKKARSSGIQLPPTNPDWHCDFHAKTEFTDPARFIVALEPKGGDGGQRSWVDEVYDALNEVCQAILDGDDIPMELFDSKSGEIIGEVVIVDANPEDVDWDGAIKIMKAKLDESESG